MLVPTLLVVATVTFFLMHLIPGSPFDETPEGERARPISPEVRKVLLARYGLDKPLWQQYLIYLWNAVRLDFGDSYIYPGRPVKDFIFDFLPTSLQLAAMASVLALVVGLPLGVLSALKQNTWVDYVTVFTALIGNIIPNFVLAIWLILLFSITLHWLPTNGWDTPQQWIMPTVSLAIGPMAVIARFTRTSVVEVIRADYVRTALAKGLTTRVILIRHVLRNALIPVITVAGPMFAGLITGAVFVESIFGVPGIGRNFVQSIPGRDYPMIMGLVLLTAVLVSVSNIVVDVLYSMVDPRIRLEDRGR